MTLKKKVTTPPAWVFSVLPAGPMPVDDIRHTAEERRSGVVQRLGRRPAPGGFRPHGPVKPCSPAALPPRSLPPECRFSPLYTGRPSPPSSIPSRRVFPAAFPVLQAARSAVSASYFPAFRERGPPCSPSRGGQRGSGPGVRRVAKKFRPKSVTFLENFRGNPTENMIG